MKNNIKNFIDPNVYNYMMRHQLLDKYFKDLANFNSNNSNYESVPKFKIKDDGINNII